MREIKKRGIAETYQILFKQVINFGIILKIVGSGLITLRNGCKLGLY